MSLRLFCALMLSVLVLPVLSSCSRPPEAKPSTQPKSSTELSQAALAAVAAQPGVPREKLARRIDALFTDEAAGETRALLVLKGGKVIAERYADGFGRDTRLPGWSMTKTITAVMIGMLVSDGRLQLDASAPVPTWQRPGDPRGEITLRQLLQMRSGLRHRENADPLYMSDEVRMLFTDGRDNMAEYAEAQPLEYEPGSTFKYSSASSVIIADIATRALTTSSDPAQRRQVMSDYLHTRVLEPLRMWNSVPEFDAAGTFVGGSMVHATGRDWASLGEFLRNGGLVKGAQIVQRDWIELMTSPSPRNRGYGMQLWLNRSQPDGREVLFTKHTDANLPANIFACLGHLGQYVIVSPDQELTLVRLGKSNRVQQESVRDRLAEIIKLFPASQPPASTSRE
jgi:CubicO group peptidase (beta-lactamase class C family)